MKTNKTLNQFRKGQDLYLYVGSHTSTVLFLLWEVWGWECVNILVSMCFTFGKGEHFGCCQIIVLEQG